MDFRKEKKPALLSFMCTLTSGMFYGFFSSWDQYSVGENAMLVCTSRAELLLFECSVALDAVKMKNQSVFPPTLSDPTVIKKICLVIS